MSIIRQIGSSFAVADLRNFATTARMLIAAFTALLLFPLLTNSSMSYAEEVNKNMLWVIPVLILVMLKAYIIHHFAPRLHNSPHAFYYAFILNQVIFLFVDVLVLQESGGAFIQHFCMFNLFMLSFMYIEAARRNSLAPSLSEARLSALTARIRPHFLFNSLNAAISLIRLRPYDAETLLENLANLFRAQLRDQPLLENAVFHGIETTHRPGIITVMTQLHKSSIYIRIENPFIPPENSENAKPHKGNSMALRNLKERLTLMYDSDAKIQSRELDGTFRVDIRLPYRKKTSDVNRLFG